MEKEYFDDFKQEYVIANLNETRLWSNYLGSTEYGAVINNYGGGYSFYKQSSICCFLRKEFNYNTLSYPGKYIYIRDNESGDYWSNTWHPVCKPLEQFKYQCKHGSGYTVIESEYHEVKSETRYFVPKDQQFEIWHLKLKNNSQKLRTLSLFSLLEYEDNSAQIEIVDEIITYSTNVKGLSSFNTFIGGKIVGIETNLNSFIGDFRTNSNPIVVQRGNFKSETLEKDVCVAIQINTVLEPDEIKDFFVFIGIGRTEYEGKKIIERFGNLEAVEKEFNKIVNNKTCVTNAIRIF